MPFTKLKKSLLKFAAFLPWWWSLNSIKCFFYVFEVSVWVSSFILAYADGFSNNKSTLIPRINTTWWWCITHSSHYWTWFDKVVLRIFVPLMRPVFSPSWKTLVYSLLVSLSGFVLRVMLSSKKLRSISLPLFSSFL